MTAESTKAVMESYFAGQSMDDVAEDAVLTLVGSGQEVHGREAIGEFISAFYNVSFNGSFESSNLIVGDGSAALEGFLVGTHSGEFAGIPATGKEVRVPMVIVYELQEGKIQHIRVYLLMATLLQQLGLAG